MDQRCNDAGIKTEAEARAQIDRLAQPDFLGCGFAHIADHPQGGRGHQVRAGRATPPCRRGYPVGVRRASTWSRTNSANAETAAIPSAQTLSVFLGNQIGSY